MTILACRRRGRIPKKFLAIAALIALALGILSISYHFRPVPAASLGMQAKGMGTVDKSPGEAFKVEITFKNKGTTDGSWKIGVAFESDGWNWAGEQKELALKPDEKETLTWDGTVSEDAPVDSTARLIVYFNDGFATLDWWIHIVSGAQLTIVGSRVS